MFMNYFVHDHWVQRTQCKTEKKLETVQSNVFAVLWKELEKSCVPCLKDSCFVNDLTIVVAVKKTGLFTNAKAVQFYLASIL